MSITIAQLNSQRNSQLQQKIQSDQRQKTSRHRLTSSETNPHHYLDHSIMPIPTSYELEQTINKFRFLCESPLQIITPAVQQDECSICQEPYRASNFDHGIKLHRPLALTCRHILGFQCLARWVLSPDSNNNCPLCRAQIVNESTNRRLSNRFLESSLKLFEMVAVMASNGIMEAQRDKALAVLLKSLPRRMSFEDDVMVHQVKVVWEEFLNQLCKIRPEAPIPATRPAAPVVQNRQTVNAPPVVPNNEQVNTQAVVRTGSDAQYRQSLSTQTLARPPAPLVNFSLTRTRCHIAILLSTTVYAYSYANCLTDIQISGRLGPDGALNLVMCVILQGSVVFFFPKSGMPSGWEMLMLISGIVLGMSCWVIARLSG